MDCGVSGFDVCKYELKVSYSLLFKSFLFLLNGLLEGGGAAGFDCQTVLVILNFFQIFQMQKYVNL